MNDTPDTTATKDKALSTPKGSRAIANRANCYRPAPERNVPGKFSEIIPGQQYIVEGINIDETDFSKAGLTTVFDKIVEQYKKTPGKISITGSESPSRIPGKNVGKLAPQRAQFARDYLISHGVDPNDILIIPSVKSNLNPNEVCANQKAAMRGVSIQLEPSKKKSEDGVLPPPPPFTDETQLIKAEEKFPCGFPFGSIAKWLSEHGINKESGEKLEKGLNWIERVASPFEKEHLEKLEKLLESLEKRLGLLERLTAKLIKNPKIEDASLLSKLYIKLFGEYKVFFKLFEGTKKKISSKVSFERYLKILERLKKFYKRFLGFSKLLGYIPGLLDLLTCKISFTRFAADLIVNKGILPSIYLLLGPIGAITEVLDLVGYGPQRLASWFLDKTSGPNENEK